MNVKFFKYQGTGNDFIIIDLRKLNININKETVKKICDRKYGVGSDGLMLIYNKKNYDFEMVFYNPDGSKSFCGNGSRCAVLYNFLQYVYNAIMCHIFTFVYFIFVYFKFNLLVAINKSHLILSMLSFLLH